MNRLNIFLETVFITFILASFCNAQNFVTDRPDFTESADVVPFKMMQIESGVEYDEFDSVSDFTFPSILARFGVGHNLEIRLGFAGWLNETIDGDSNIYLNDTIVEAKYRILSPDAKIPMAVLLVSTLPTGDEDVSVEKVEFGVKYACSYDIKEHMSLGANIGAISTCFDSRKEIRSLASISLGIEMNDKISTFFELYTENPEGEPSQPVMDCGLTCLITPVIQADVYLGKGLNDKTVDVIVGCGLSFRVGL